MSHRSGLTKACSNHFRIQALGMDCAGACSNVLRFGFYPCTSKTERAAETTPSANQDMLGLSRVFMPHAIFAPERDSKTLEGSAVIP
jgi:hypothetical protein